MTKDQLLENLAGCGYPLLRPAANKAEEVLESLLEQEDYRLLEGFPVVLMNLLKAKEPSEWEEADWNVRRLSKKVRARLPYLLALSFLLFKSYRVGGGCLARTSKLLMKLPNGNKVFQAVSKPFLKSEPVGFDGFKFSPERLKNTFQTYALQSTQSKELEQKRRVLERELLLSEIFTPRQKMLLKKKLEAEPLTKTEREYYSRVVKKRLRVLADDDLHQLAHRLLHQ